MRRPARRQRGGARAFVSIAVVVVLLLAGGALGGTAYYNHELHSASAVGRPVSFEIPPGTSTSAVADLLGQKGLIRNKLVFEAYVRLHGFTIEAGTYEVPAGATMEQVVALLAHSESGTEVTVTIPEGYTAKQIGTLLQKKGLFNADAFLAATHQQYPMDFLAGHDPALGLDGYLFPDTYQVSLKATPAEVVTMLLKHFGEKVPVSLRARAPAGTTLAQAVVLASIVEREAFFDKDRPAVAGVFYNRLKAGMPLQSDATVAYAVGRAGADITEDDKQVNSPYNTYLHTGLPPGGISNPGLASITAALEPMPSDNLYYLTDKDGHAHFSKTYAQHQQCQVNLAVCPTLP